MVDILLSFIINLTIKKKQISFLLEVGKQGQGQTKTQNIKINNINETSTKIFTKQLKTYFFFNRNRFLFQHVQEIKIITKDRDCSHNILGFCFRLDWKFNKLGHVYRSLNNYKSIHKPGENVEG